MSWVLKFEMLVVCWQEAPALLLRNPEISLLRNFFLKIGEEAISRKLILLYQDQNETFFIKKKNIYI